MEINLKIFEIFLILLAMLLSVCWFLNPEGNYEPSLVLIGFIFTAAEIYRRKIAPSYVAAPNKSSFPAEQVTGDVANTIQKSPLNENVQPDQITGVSIEEILGGIDRSSYTGIQILQFVKRNSGLEVIWRVRVHNIQSAFEQDPGSDLYLIFSPESQKDDYFPKVVVAVFDRSSEGDLAAVSTGDIAVIRGEISFIEHAGQYSLTLKNTKLIKFYKNA